MADNTELDVGSGGKKMASAQLSISGDIVEVQMCGLGILSGGEGTWIYSQHVGGAGVVAAGVQRMTLASDDPAVASLGIIDDWDESDRAKVNLIVGQAGIAAGEGVDGVTVPRMSLATDVALPTGANTIGAVNVNTGNSISTNNSTTATLGNGAVYTGTADDCLGCAGVTTSLLADEDGAVDGMTFQFSPDGSNWDDVNTFTYTAANGARRFSFPVTARYYRVVYTNGASGQTLFRVQTMLHREPVTRPVHRLVDDISPDRSATLVKSVVAMQSAGSGDFIVLQATASGNAKISLEEVNGVNLPVSPIVGQTGVAAGSGAVDVLTQRMILATDDPLVAKTPALGTAAMAASAPVTLATDDTQFGAVGASSDVDGNVHGQLRYIGENIDEVHVRVEALDAIASWAASTDASAIAQETDNVPSHDGTTSLSIAKTGTATTEASYSKTLGATVDASILSGDATVSFYVRHGNYTTVEQVFVRIGTDSSNYVEYGFDPAEFSTTLWTNVVVPLHEGLQTGTGLDLANIDYVAFGVTMTASGNTIADVFFNALELHSVSGIELAISSDVSASPVRVSKMGSVSNQNVATGAGSVTSGVQRTTLASDDPAVAALETLDNTVAVLGTATYAEATTSGNVVGAVRNDDKATLADTDNEIAPLQVDNEGALYVNAAAAENKSASGVAAGGAPGADVMIAAVGGKKILVTALSLTATSTTVNSVYIDNVDNDLWANADNPVPLSMEAAGDNVPGIVLNYNPAGWFKTDTVNEAVTLNTSAAQDIAWSISWIETD